MVCNSDCSVSMKFGAEFDHVVTAKIRCKLALLYSKGLDLRYCYLRHRHEGYVFIRRLSVC